MSGSMQYSGFDNLANRMFGTLRVLQLERRVPALAWRYRCNRCSTEGVLPHATFTNGSARCPNASCECSVPAASSGGQTMHIPTGIRSSDSASARQFARSQRIQVSFKEPSAEAFTNADPDTIRRYLDSRKVEK